MTVADNSNRKTVDLDAVIRSNLANACVPRLDESNCERNLCYNAYFRWMLLAFYFLAFFTFETVLRTMDGTCNNLQNPLRGAAYRPYTRLLPTVYDNELSEPVGERFLNPPLLRYFLAVTRMVLEELLLAVSISSSSSFYVPRITAVSSRGYATPHFISRIRCLGRLQRHDHAVRAIHLPRHGQGDASPSSAPPSHRLFPV